MFSCEFCEIFKNIFFIPANISTLFQHCLLVDTTLRRGATSNQRWNKVVYFIIHNVQQRILTLIWTTLDNVETTLSFSTLSFTTLKNVETTLWKWPFLKRTETKLFQIEQTGIQSFNYYFIIFFTLPPMLRRICRRELAKSRKVLKRSWKILHCKNLF